MGRFARLFTAMLVIAPSLGVATAVASASAVVGTAVVWQMKSNGIGLPGKGAPALVFDRSTQASAIAAVTTAIGKPQKRGTYPDCGQGEPLGYADFAGGLSLSFSKGKFVGWTINEGGDKRFVTERGIGLHATLAALKRAYPSTDTDDGSLGPTFQTEDGPNGFLDSMKPSGKIVSMYAGTTCIVG